MNLKSFLLSGLAGTFVYFLLGWTFYDILFPDIHSKVSEPNLLYILLGCLFMAFLMALIFSRWAQIKTFSTGLKVGFVFGFLYTLSMNFFMYSTQSMDANFFTGLVIEAVILAVVGGFIGFVNGANSYDT
jgi:hypothetical protein